MYHHICALLVLATFVGATNVDNRLIGGQNTTIEQHPYQVSLQYHAGTHICGGCLIKEDYVLTAAHCLVRNTQLAVFVMAGYTNNKQDGKRLQAERREWHPDFERRRLDYDIAVIKLVEPVKRSASISTISLVPVGEKPRHGEMMTVTGWGFLEVNQWKRPHGILQSIRIPVIDNTYCNNIYQSNNVTDRMFCALGGTNPVIAAYKGDSGGPITNEKHQLVGLVSWANPNNMTGRPVVCTDLSNPDIRKYINGIINLPKASTRVP